MRIRRRRGIGTVIATAVMIFLMVFTIGQLYVYSIDELDNYNRAAAQSFATQSQKLNEHLSIQSITLDTGGTQSSDILATLVISNSGGATSQIVDVWFDNSDTSTILHTVDPVSNVYVPRGLSTTLSNLDTGTSVFSYLGTATGGSSTTLATTLPSGTTWVSNEWAGSTVKIVSGTGAGSTGTISASGAGSGGSSITITVNPGWSGTSPGSNSVFGIIGIQPTIKASVITALGNTVSVTLLPAGKAGTGPQTLASVSLIVIPPNPITTNDISVVLTVTNNNGLGAAFTNLVPDICLVEGNPTLSTVNSWNTCKTALTQCATLSYPVTCIAVPGFSNPTPSSVSYLPYGSTAVFQWIFEVDTVLADSPITVLASYAPLSTQFYSSSSLPQAAHQSITVRTAGGASGNSGGNFLNAIGSLVNYFNSFQACQPNMLVCSSISPAAWTVGLALSAGTETIFRMNVTNIGSNMIQFNSNSEVLVLDSKTGKIYDFYIIAACTAVYQPYYAAGATCTPLTYPGTGYFVAPSQTATVYFTGTIVGSTTEQKLGAPGESGQSWTATVAFYGLRFNGAGVTQTVGATTSAVSVTALVGAGMPASGCSPNCLFTLLLQTGWNTGQISLSGGSSCTYGPFTPTLGQLTISGLDPMKCGSSFTLNFQYGPPTCSSYPCTDPHGGTYYGPGYTTFAYGFYNTNSLLSTGGSLNYAQASSVFAVRT